MSTIKWSELGDPTHFTDKHALSMTLRDYFAAMAMQGFCAADDTGNWSRSEMAESSYAMADAMLKARFKKGESE